MGEMLTLEDLASKIHVSFATIRRMKRDGQLPQEIRVRPRCVRFRAADVEAWERKFSTGEVSGSRVLLGGPGA
jgi:predicted DNA-binding transcriptional regulator AlpA